MDKDYAFAFYEAIRAAMYITDPQLRDDILREILFINKRMFPTKPQSTEQLIPEKVGIARRPVQASTH